MKHKIYALHDMTGDIRYIGQSSQKLLSKRLSQHRKFAKDGKTNNHKDNWMRQVYAEGGDVKIKLIELCDPEEANKREEHWINQFKKEGYKLTNTQPVGKRNYKPGIMRWSDSHKEYLRKVSKKLGHVIKAMVPVLCYDLNGTFIREYNGMGEALRDVGALKDYTNDIKNVCTGKWGQMYGHIWRYKTDNYPLQIEPFRDPRHKKVAKCNEAGEILVTYDKIRDAASALNMSEGMRNHITSCCKGRRKHAGGFKWKFIE